MKLSEVSEGKTIKVVKFLPEIKIKRRLQDLGVVRGTIIECVSKSPAGDPTSFLIKGALIAIRKDDSQYVEVEEIKI